MRATSRSAAGSSSSGSARDGLIEDSAFGACVLVTGFDIEALREAIVWRRNGVDIDTTSRRTPDEPLLR